jgi:hypothetical protein
MARMAKAAEGGTLKRLATGVLLASYWWVTTGAQCMAADLNYDDLIMLDSEELAETGIKQAYEELLPILGKHLATPASITEKIDNDAPSYSVVCQGVTYHIYSPGDQDKSWGKATFAFFDIVNRQLAQTRYRLFAINGGNDLAALLLTVADAEAAKMSLENKQDWPYLPTAEAPWHGMYH